MTSILENECCEFSKMGAQAEDGRIFKLCQKHFDLFRCPAPGKKECGRNCSNTHSLLGRNPCPCSCHSWPNVGGREKCDGSYDGCLEGDKWWHAQQKGTGCKCECHQPPPTPDKCFCGGSDKTGHIPTEGHTEHKPADSGKCDCLEGVGCKVCDPKHPKFKRDYEKAVEDKIKEIKQWAIHYVCPTGSLDERLRELVAVARGSK